MYNWILKEQLGIELLFSYFKPLTYILKRFLVGQVTYYILQLVNLDRNMHLTPPI